MRKILIVGLMLIASGNVYSENKLSTSEVNTLNQYIYDSTVKENFIKLNRVTRKGSLVSCELEFQNTYRDNRELKDGVMRTVFSVGSFSINYTPENHMIGALLKVIPSVIDIKTQQWEKLYPPYLDIFINEESLEKYKIGEIKGEIGGKLIAYGDKQGGSEMLKSILKSLPLPFDGEIKLSLIKDGMDTGYKLSSLTTNENWVNESDKFTKCNFDLLDILLTGLDKLSVEEKKTAK